MKKLLLSTAAIAVMGLSAGVAYAVPTLNSVTATADATVAAPVLIEQTVGLNFGTFAIYNDAVNNASITTDGSGDNKVQVLGGQLDAEFDVIGEGNASYTLALTDTGVAGSDKVTLTNAGNTMTADLATTGGLVRNLTAGADSITVVGTISGLSGGQASGLYQGTYTATVTYP